MNNTTIQPTAFREYDIRGIIGSEIAIQATYGLARAIAAYFTSKNPAMTTVAVGMDGRIHSPAIKEQVCQALTDSGLNVVFLGVCPSPLLYFALHEQPVDAGIMITASHNPKEYNGFKICLGKDAVWGDELRAIRDLFYAGATVQRGMSGTITESPIHDYYCTWLSSHFSHLRGLELPVVIDCGNGTAGTVFPQLIDNLGWRGVHLLYPEVDGTYPHHDADPVLPENMQDVRAFLQKNPGSAYGIGLDGDADRMAVMTKDGYLVPGDQLLAVLARPIIAQQPGACVVCDITSSDVLLRALDNWGARTLMVATGHANIKSAIKKNKAVLGGELSCHFTFADRYFGFDDGIYAALRLIELIHTSGKTLQELLSVLPRTYSSPAIRIPCQQAVMPAMIDAIKKHFIGHPDAHLITTDGVRACTEYGWGLIRSSNTQPVICLRFESLSPEGLVMIKKEFCTVLAAFVDPALLSSYVGV